MDKTKRIGIITHYYKTRNYGGALQAYALCAYLNDRGYQAEQIAFSAQQEKEGSRGVLPAVKKQVKRFLNLWVKAGLESRAQAFDAFLGTIPHSAAVFSGESIGVCVNDYDIFLTGSDQVWNMDWFQAPYFLSFVPSEKRKLSYAASLGKGKLTPENEAYFRSVLADYHAVSVREEDSVALLQPISPVPVECVVDPVLLLSAQQWDRVCSHCMVPEKYLFCYFLGADKRVRDAAKAFARKKGLRIVTIPHLQQRLEPNDLLLGGKQLCGAAPGDFVSLIKHAEYVFTDSFHATVFSCIYGVQFFVFPRKGSEAMGNRLLTLTRMFDCEHRFRALDALSVGELENVPPFDPQKENSFATVRAGSENYLARTLSE